MNSFKEKYRMTDESCDIDGVRLYRIRSLVEIPRYYVRVGSLGGWIEGPSNLSHEGDSWVSHEGSVYGDARVYGNSHVCNTARVYGSAYISGDACISTNARVYGNAIVYGGSRVGGSACVYGDARLFDFANVSGSARVYGSVNLEGVADISGDALVSSSIDYIVFKNFWSSGKYFTWTRSNNKWKYGYFHGSGSELLSVASKYNLLSVREFSRVIKYVDTVLESDFSEPKNPCIF